MESLEALLELLTPLARLGRPALAAIDGRCGSGKSTLFGALSGLYRYQGSARLEGTELSRHRRRLTGRMGFVTQSPQDQFVADTVLDEVAVSLRHSTGAGNPAAGAEDRKSVV